MLVALTGASGFVGSYTAKALHTAGHQVRALVRSESRRDHIASSVTEWTVGDQSDPQGQAALVAGVDAVIHNSADWEALEQSPVRNYERNVLASLRLLDAARAAGVAQFLFVSSVAVYQEIPDSEGGRITEETPAWPGSIYGAYKAAVEPHLKAYQQTYGMNTSAWRPAAIYGVTPNREDAQWLDIVREAKRGGRVSTDKGGKITHVQDVADALTLAIDDPSVAGQLFNLVDCYMYWQVAAEFAKQLSGSSATIEERKRGGPRNQFDCRKAIAFFDRHGNGTALRRGTDGVRQYVAELLPTA
jgi:nucleoside-diphosphate-sugar epimerase